jgi:hypothetical protein
MYTLHLNLLSLVSNKLISEIKLEADNKLLVRII